MLRLNGCRGDPVACGGKIGKIGKIGSEAGAARVRLSCLLWSSP
jgi:hypothetical protein